MTRKKVIALILVVVCAVLFSVISISKLILDWWGTKGRYADMTTEIEEYEEYLGKEGKYKKNFMQYNDIFPDVIPKTASVESFGYYYYNFWDPCYLGYLVYTCEEEEYQQEYERLKSIFSSEKKYIYGTTEFPYELCAVYTDETYGYIYAMTDPAEKKFIYAELKFCNYIMDIDYKKIIDEKYLPIGFDATNGNETRKQYMQE